MIAQAQSGTGKTATFSISILQRIDAEQKNVQALVMAPTRELAQQVSYLFYNLYHLHHADPKSHVRSRRLHENQCSRLYWWNQRP